LKKLFFEADLVWLFDIFYENAMNVQTQSSGGCCVYQSAKLIRTSNPVLATIYWLLTLSLLVYVAVYQIYLKKGYQLKENGLGTISTKVKGTATNNSVLSNLTEWDIFTADDLVFPDTEQNALFVTTSVIYTPQFKGKCNGNKKTGMCKSSADCTRILNWDSHGALTGKCVDGMCEVMGWCPLESDRKDSLMSYYGVENFTIFLKVNLRFQKFGVSLTNAVNANTSNHELTPGFNLFTIDDILHRAQTKISDISRSGAIIVCTISYECDLDKSVEKCEHHPHFSFQRIDDVTGTVSPGYNFRTTTYQDYTSVPQVDLAIERILIKRVGVRILFDLEGVAGRFDLSVLTISLGSGLAILGLATVITDYIMIRCVKHHDQYYERQGEYIKLSDGERSRSEK